MSLFAQNFRNFNLWEVKKIIQLLSFDISLNVFTEFSEFSDKIFVIIVKGLKPANQPPPV